LLEFYQSIIDSLQELSQSNDSVQDVESLLQIADLKIEITYFALENLLCTLQSKFRFSRSLLHFVKNDLFINFHYS